MEEAELGTSKSKPSQSPMTFPPYRRSHFRSQTYHTLVRILSHLSPSTIPTHPLHLPDDGNGRMGQGNQEKELECSEFKVGSDFMDPKDPVPQKEMHEVHETIEGVGDKGRDFSANEMVLDDIALLMGIEEPSAQTNGFHKEQKLMDRLELVGKGTEDPACDNGLIPLNSGLGEKQNGGSEVELMDYEVEHVEFLHSDANTSGNASNLQVPGELNQLALEGQASASVIGTSSLKHESQQKETELVKSVCAVVGSLPTTDEGEFEKDEQHGQKVAEATHNSLDLDMNIETLNMSEDGGLLDSTILTDKHETQNGEQLEKSICVNNATNSSNILIEEADVEEGEISGEGDVEEGEISEDFDMDGNSFDVSSADAIILQQMKVDEVQKPKNVIGNMAYPCKIGNGKKDEGYQSNSFMVNALQDANGNGQVEPRTRDKNGIACGIELAISRKTIELYKAGKYGSALKPENSQERQIGSKGINDMPTNLTQNQVLHRGFLEETSTMEETSTKDHQNSSAVKMVDASRKKKCGPGSKKKKNKKKQVIDPSRKRKHGPDSEEKEDEKKMVDASRSKKRGLGSEEKKEKKRMKYRKKRAEKNRELGVKRLKLLPVQKPKTVTYCRHYIKGRCHEGDKCQFSHDTVPSTKSKPCVHFARHSCMKGDDCPFDHQLSNYPCNNFMSRGSCSRGDACMFSHQVPTNQVIPTPSNVCKPELKSPLLSGNTSFSTPLNNHGCSSVQQNHFTNSNGINSHLNSENKVTDTSRKQPTSAPKGIRFINVANLSPSPSTPKQDMVTPNKESVVQNGTRADKGAPGTTQNIVEIPKKLSTVTPTGINFLSFGKGPVCSFKSSISSHLNRENGIKLPQLVNFGLPKQASSSLNKGDYGKVSDGTKQNVQQTDLFSNERLKWKFPGKASIDDSMRDDSHCKSVQEGKKAYDNSQTSSVTSAIPLVRPFVSHQSSQCLVSGYHKQAPNSGQRALLSTLAFAAEHESDIKMKCPTGASPV